MLWGWCLQPSGRQHCLHHAKAASPKAVSMEEPGWHRKGENCILSQSPSLENVLHGVTVGLSCAGLGTETFPVQDIL